MEDPGPGDCPTLADLATFCWGQGSVAARAFVLDHLSRCRGCRTQAARIAATCRTDGGKVKPPTSLKRKPRRREPP